MICQGVSRGSGVSGLAFRRIQSTPVVSDLRELFKYKGVVALDRPRTVYLAIRGGVVYNVKKIKYTDYKEK